LANITVRWNLLSITGVVNRGRTFRGFSDVIIWITASKISNERIPQALFQAFANSSLELTFRQACTHDRSGEVEFLEFTHCIATDGDFRFVANNFLKPTVEEREFLNGKTYQTKTTFKSIFFAETIRTRRLNQRKVDYISSLDRLKEKVTCSSFLCT